MLNALSVTLRRADQAGSQRVASSMDRQGFLPAPGYEWGDGVLSVWGHPGQQTAENFDVRTSAGVACCIGPIWYRGHFGGAALSLLLNEIGGSHQIDESELRGNFAVFLCTDDCYWLMNDVLGFVRIYASADGCFYSTSWLATCAYAGGVELDEAAAAEYVLLGASHSDRTVARGITTLPLAHAFDLTRGCTRARLPADIWDETRVVSSFDAVVDQFCSYFRTVCAEITVAFPGRTRAALSGGFDSRLILAGLLASDNRPELFVYGASNSEDLPIARSVADSAGIPLDVIDKSVLNRQSPLPDTERLVDSALFFDGLPNDGIYDPGADERTRLAQTAGGCLALNGGGGEIFRNFFHLPDRSLRAVDIVRAFYRGFDPQVFRRADGLACYEDSLVSSIRRSLGLGSTHSGQALRREQVELIYPLFRCHHWMSVNNSVAVRQGHYVTPLIDLNTVRLGCPLPMAWKNAGRLESRLIANLHQVVANQPSAYGFRFADGPGWRAHLAERAACMRPVFARPFINAARRRLRKLGVAPEMLAHCRSLLPGEWRLDPVLNLGRLPDNQAFARALAVEIAWRELVA